jgi:hypothetical protein
VNDRALHAVEYFVESRLAGEDAPIRTRPPKSALAVDRRPSEVPLHEIVCAENHEDYFNQ